MQLLDVLVESLPIADVPEYLIRKYLPGDDCLDYCDTMNTVFTKKYYGNKDGYECTFLDEQCTISHSFNDEPAAYSNHHKFWYKNGKLHRENDNPAVIYGRDQVKQWYNNGKLHRENDNPAVIYYDRFKEWYIYGQRHRDNDKPAVIYNDGFQEWWRHGEQIS